MPLDEKYSNQIKFKKKIISQYCPLWPITYCDKPHDYKNVSTRKRYPRPYKKCFVLLSNHYGILGTTSNDQFQRQLACTSTTTLELLIHSYSHCLLYFNILKIIFECKLTIPAINFSIFPSFIHKLTNL